MGCRSCSAFGFLNLCSGICKSMLLWAGTKLLRYSLKDVKLQSCPAAIHPTQQQPKLTAKERFLASSASVSNRSLQAPSDAAEPIFQRAGLRFGQQTLSLQGARLWVSQVGRNVVQIFSVSAESRFAPTWVCHSVREDDARRGHLQQAKAPRNFSKP